ncbi:GNAT family N-acetyltransferase [Aquimarina sp. ERC-38]|uniref:GNAT family N-acetyltransferase n=1 Tax=Aquimarina sp. ERC-38 TaxID=2949996 RepID=UPI0022459169|nr:GNAT family N-acetyltransferase [Aquimarina sp. ERC-38]UZO79960.1 GNAT family N-acetyltransferase [Aquimarina sp. ERC-38]
MIIRKIADNEIEFLKEMLYEAIFVEDGQPQLPKSIIKKPNLAKYITDFGLKKTDVCLVAIENKTLVGACWGRLFNEKDKGYGFINSKTPELSIAVKVSYRNKGIGTKLIEEIIKLYQELNIKSISLSVDKRNPAFRLYSKLGFEVKVETDKSLIMQREL